MSKWKQAGLLCAGVLGGILISIQVSALAEKETRASLPVEELRTLAEVFNAIKKGYVEPVDDKTLITHAISGMLSNLDPHSTYLDVDAFKDLQVGTQGEFGGIGIEVGMEDGLVKVVSPIDDSVVAPDGQAHGLPGLYITDSSIFPTSLGVNPQLTTMAMATKVRRMLRSLVMMRARTRPTGIMSRFTANWDMMKV